MWQLPEMGGHTVTDCELVRAFLALLFLVDHPGDGHAWAMVAGSPLASILDLKPEDGLDGSPAVARRERTEILSEGLGPWLVGLRDKTGGTYTLRGSADGLIGDRGLMLGRIVLTYA